MTGPDAPLVLSECDARGVHTLTLNRPHAFNSLSEGMLDALQSRARSHCGGRRRACAGHRGGGQGLLRRA